MRPPLRTAYNRGRELEYRVRNELLAAGYEVIRGAGSKGAGDLWAAKHGTLLIVQVKRDPRAFSSAAWNALLGAALRGGASAVLATAAARGPVRYWRLVDARDTGSHARPWEPLDLENSSKEPA